MQQRQVKVIVEKHPDGYVAYPPGVRGVVVGQGDSYEEALADVGSALAFHVGTFGPEALYKDSICNALTESDQPCLHSTFSTTRFATR